jgi:hypothetical protein
MLVSDLGVPKNKQRTKEGGTRGEEKPEGGGEMTEPTPLK